MKVKNCRIQLYTDTADTLRLYISLLGASYTCLLKREICKFCTIFQFYVTYNCLFLLCITVYNIKNTNVQCALALCNIHQCPFFNKHWTLLMTSQLVYFFIEIYLYIFIHSYIKWNKDSSYFIFCTFAFSFCFIW